MSIFRGMRNVEVEKLRKQDRAEKAAAEQEKRESARAERSTALISEVIDEAAQTPAQDGGELLFTREQAAQMLQTFLERERALDTPTELEQQAAKLARDEMMLKFRADLVDHGLPADEIIETFDNFDFTTPEGLRDAVDDIMELYETISIYSEQYEATLAAKRDIPDRKPDVIRKIFEVGGHV